MYSVYLCDQMFSDKLLMDIRAKLFHTQLTVKNKNS